MIDRAESIAAGRTRRRVRGRAAPGTHTAMISLSRSSALQRPLRADAGTKTRTMQCGHCRGAARSVSQATSGPAHVEQSKRRSMCPD